MAKMRSPNYPAIGLHEAIQRTKSLWMKEKRTAVPAEVAAKAIGYSGLSGPSRTALAALKKFGLVDSDDQTVCVSDLALRVLHPENQEAELEALQESALKPELFSQLYQSHVNASDDAIRSYLINKLEFSESGAKQLIKAFRNTISLALLDKPPYNTPSKSAQEGPMQRSDTANVTVPVTGNELRANLVASRNTSAVNTAQTFSWPLGPGVFAEVRITGGELKSEYFDALRQYLELAQRLVDTNQSKEQGSERAAEHSEK
jgi:hypothetical protein